ncbi:MAG: ATP-binding protein [Clostridia bacterium]|nr:ATP-binding protein [Clostridia bacterium]
MINNLKKIVSKTHKAIVEYNMLKQGDKVAVALSGGKDSLLLLQTLAIYKTKQKFDFDIVAISVDVFGNTDYTKIEDFCNELKVPFFVIKSNIKEIVFDIKKEKNPCSLCANLRRGMLNSKAKELGCNKVALGHHADDFIQTFFMSVTKENRLSSFWPLSYLSRIDLFVIRPFLYVWENEIISHSEFLPIIKSCCPANKLTERENMKNILEDLNKKIPKFKNNLLESLCKTERYNLFDKSKKLIK